MKLPTMRMKWSAFQVAFAGIAFMLRTQVNARWHLLASIVTLAAALIFRVSPIEWIALTLAAGLVWVAEALNTAVEQACDAITLDRHPQIGRAKDVAAGAVLLAAICAVAVGLLVFVPRLMDLMA